MESYFNQNTKEAVFCNNDFDYTIKLEHRIEINAKHTLNVYFTIEPNSNKANYHDLKDLCDIMQAATSSKNGKSVKLNRAITIICKDFILTADGYINNVKAKNSYQDRIMAFSFNVSVTTYSINHCVGAERKHFIDTALKEI